MAAPPPDFESLRTQFAAAVPFARLAGVEITEIADGTAAAQLAQSDALSNHIGSLHAGAIFTLGETASGAAMLGAFAPMAAAIRPLAMSANISYLKLGRGIVKARARTDSPGAALRQRLLGTGLAVFAVHVDIQDTRERTVAQLTVSWHVTMPKAS